MQPRSQRESSVKRRDYGYGRERNTVCRVQVNLLRVLLMGDRHEEVYTVDSENGQ
jgi:hypothetical protein